MEINSLFETIPQIKYDNTDTRLLLKRTDWENMSTTVVKSVLIVDDEEAILFAFSKVLKRPDLEIHTAQTLNDALILLKKNSYAIVITDLRLSGSANFEGYTVLTNVGETQNNCKVIIMTAFGDEKIKEKVFSLGADFYLEKPVSAQKVKELIASMGIY
jgi:DNA-binding NtrC family response regulator